MYNLEHYSAILDGVGDNKDIHVRNSIPRRPIKINTCALVVDPARAILLKQPKHAGSSRLMQFSKHCRIN